MDKKLTKISGIIAGMEYQNTQKEKKLNKKLYAVQRDAFHGVSFFL